MDHVGVPAGQVIADIQQPTGLDVDAGLLTHLPHQRGSQGLPMLDLPAGQRPGPAGAGVLIEQKDLLVIDDNGGDAHSDRRAHGGTVAGEMPR